ncbi:MAG: helix-turn-helix transcriptional regulator [Verrucomicrobiae bacterium]|nr:helix-turn-helix transcriptional regulator [Verrucomicrobiae bacterium]
MKLVRPRHDFTKVDPVVAMAFCVPTSREQSIDWHTQAWDGLCLHTNGSTLTGIDGRKNSTQENTLFLVKSKVRRGSWNPPDRKPPKLWCILFAASPALYATLPHLSSADPWKLVWKLNTEQASLFKNLFLKLVAEQSSNLPARHHASSAWLRLMLVEIERWAGKQTTGPSSPQNVPPDVLELWERVNEDAYLPGESEGLLQDAFPHYNSLRHRFKKAFGLSPQQMLQALRIDRAKHLLLGTQASVKEVANHLGYSRPHEFARAFRRQVGLTPTEWRANPLAKS